MLQFFRSFFKSTLGIGLTLAMVGIIALAFAAGDVASSGGFGGVAGGDRAAIVGKQRIGTAEYSAQITQGFETARHDNPTLTMKAFVAGGGAAQVLDQMVDRTAIAVFGKDNGIVAGKRLVDSELAKIPSLQGPDGKFNNTLYLQMLAQRHYTDDAVRQDIAQGMIARQVLIPAEFGASQPLGAAMRYATLLKEHRIGAVAALPSEAFAPKVPPTAEEIATFYATHRNSYIRPERRVIRYAVMSADTVKAPPASDAEVAAAYHANAAAYVAVQNRTVAQLVLPSKDAASAVLASLRDGTGLDAAAAGKGLSVAKLGPLSQAALALQSSADVAAAAFAARAGVVSGPVKSQLGWSLIRVDAIENKPARSLAQAHGEIAAALAIAKRRTALADATAKLEDQFDKGGALSDAAKGLGLSLSSTAPLTADGKVYGRPAQTAPKELARILPTAFAMERENAPQLAEIDPGKSFVLFDVTQITASSPAPLAEIKSQIANDCALEKGAIAARAAGLKVQAELKKGVDLAAAIASLGVALPAPHPLAMGREQLAAMGGKVPAVLGLFFGMAQGTAKLLPLPNNAGWFVVQVKQIIPGTVAEGDPLIADTAKGLGQLAGNEYAEQLRNALRRVVGVTHNDVAIKAVTTQLAGGN